MCRLTRKPRPVSVRDIGAWYTAFKLIGRILRGIFRNFHGGGGSAVGTRWVTKNPENPKFSLIQERASSPHSPLSEYGFVLG